MKGFVPPPRLTISNEPLPITREITITEGISVKDLAEKLGIRAKDLITRLLAQGKDRCPDCPELGPMQGSPPDTGREEQAAGRGKPRVDGVETY